MGKSSNKLGIWYYLQMMGRSSAGKLLVIVLINVDM